MQFTLVNGYMVDTKMNEMKGNIQLLVLEPLPALSSN